MSGVLAVTRGSYASMRASILRQVVAEEGSVRKAAVVLGVPRSTLGAWMRQLDEPKMFVGVDLGGPDRTGVAYGRVKDGKIEIVASEELTGLKVNLLADRDRWKARAETAERDLEGVKAQREEARAENSRPPLTLSEVLALDIPDDLKAKIERMLRG